MGQAAKIVVNAFFLGIRCFKQQHGAGSSCGKYDLCHAL